LETLVWSFFFFFGPEKGKADAILYKSILPLGIVSIPSTSNSFIHSFPQEKGRDLKKPKIAKKMQQRHQ